MRPAYNLDKIKFATDQPTFEKAVALYEAGKVTQFKERIGSYSAVVLGTKPYRVLIEARRFGLANCECYLGQRDTLLRLDKRLCTGGVDDSNGTVGGFMYEVVEMLEEYAKIDPKCIKAFKKLCGQSTCFGWEEPLVKIFDKQDK